MAYSRVTRVLPIILIFVIIVIAIVAMISLARVIFFPGASSTSSTTPDTSLTALLDTSPTHSVKMTVRGPIVADEDFRSYQITISPSSRSLVTYKGYLDTVIDNVALDNNTTAYDQFVHALDKANLTKGTAFTGDQNNLLGICATGQVTDFDIIDGTNVVKDLWTSTCSGSKGSLNANVTQLSDLFITQIPDATTTIQKLDI